MNIPDIPTRLMFYKEMYKTLRKDKTPISGFCHHLAHVQRELRLQTSSLDYYSVSSFPELMEFEPKYYYKGFLHARRYHTLRDFAETGYWFRRDIFGKWYRLWILRKAIKKLS